MLAPCLQTSCTSQSHPQVIFCTLKTILTMSITREGWLHQTANPNNHVKVDTLPAGLGVVIATLEPTGMFNDDVDCPRNPNAGADSVIPADVTKEQLEARLQADCLPYMRIATLLRHYIYR